ILLLGSGESGKTTVIKGIKIVNKILSTPQELQDIASSLRRNAIQCMNVLIEQIELLGFKVEDESLQAHIDVVKKIGIDDDDGEVLTLPMVDAIIALWNSELIAKVWARRKEYWILDSTEFYFKHVARFSDEDFEPTEEDSVMARVMTTGILTTEINISPLRFTVVDVGGQRNERRKWIHTMDDCSVIVYVVNLAGYNSVLFEDQTQNRMVECLSLFKQTANNPIFAETPIFLIFNKKDLFETKIREDPITSCPCFEDFKGSSELRENLDFIENKFKSQIMSGSPNRVKVFHIAARFKKDVKEVWDELTEHLRVLHKKDIEVALKYLEKHGVAVGAA
ncbi:hypothetical protein HK096_003055, partial [Nowakowskiella sp. JEL0078]